ncbi:hypothetical protein QQ73_07635, partial [Candidatus Endoriftia persephone str. Guaymas]|nr:hypothetical protein [Candidatus Endoriftia persephone str. Guaymas]
MLYALSPNNKFRHKIGMGKPLGLGSIQIEVESLERDNPVKRYQSDPFAQNTPTTEEGDKGKSWEEYREEFKAQANQTAIQALERLGNPANVAHPVHYPQVAGADLETEN